MMMTVTTMCRTEMIKKHRTTLFLVVTSRLFFEDKTTTSPESPRRCPYNTGRKSIFHKI
jgi:hypothetical protein